jgi:hypothetical protein
MNTMNTTRPRRSNGSATYFLGRPAATWRDALNRRRPRQHPRGDSPR